MRDGSAITDFVSAQENTGAREIHSCIVDRGHAKGKRDTDAAGYWRRRPEEDDRRENGIARLSDFSAGILQSVKRNSRAAVVTNRLQIAAPKSLLSSFGSCIFSPASEDLALAAGV